MHLNSIHFRFLHTRGLPQNILNLGMSMLVSPWTCSLTVACNNNTYQPDAYLQTSHIFHQSLASSPACVLYCDYTGHRHRPFKRVLLKCRHFPYDSHWSYNLSSWLCVWLQKIFYVWRCIQKQCRMPITTCGRSIIAPWDAIWHLVGSTLLQVVDFCQRANTLLE